MRKYWAVYALSLQDALQRRSTLLMDRVGGLAILFALYYFWSALFQGKPSLLGYTREQMLTYVLLMNLLRSFVFMGRGWELVGEISSGRLSAFLVRPLRYQLWCLAVDLSHKTVHLVSAVLEIGLLVLLIGAPWYLPQRASTWPVFLASMAVSSILFFLLEFCVASLAFWTSESGGPLFCFELFLQFAAGAFFPIDVLPEAVQNVLRSTPFPYIVFFPINIYLERVDPGQALRLLALQAAWLIAAALAAQAVWRKGLKTYAAEGG